MAKNHLLSHKITQDIDERVGRVLRGLGTPDPPLNLDDVRELLKLDRAFYTADDPGIAQEAVSRIRVATIQVMQRPTLVIDAIRKFSLKALYLPDRKRILLDKSEPIKKHRWNEAHEIGHSLIPWHEDVMLGDNAHTLSQDCREQVEAEANFAAGRLLFLRERFTAEAQAMDLTIASIQSLHGTFGNTLSTTLYRFIEVAGKDRPLVGLISCHPHVSRRPSGHDPSKRCRHFIQSRAFATRFGRTSEAAVFDAIAGYCGAQSGGPLGAAELILSDDNGDRHRFSFETFFNRYDALTLGVYLHPERLIVAVPS